MMRTGSGSLFGNKCKNPETGGEASPDVLPPVSFSGLVSELGEAVGHVAAYSLREREA